MPLFKQFFPIYEMDIKINNLRNGKLLLCYFGIIKTDLPLIEKINFL